MMKKKHIHITYHRIIQEKKCKFKQGKSKEEAKCPVEQVSGFFKRKVFIVFCSNCNRKKFMPLPNIRNYKKTSPRVLGSYDELLSLLELISTKNTTNFKLKTFTICFRLNAQTLGSDSDFNFKIQLQTSTATSNFNFKLQLQTSTSNFNFKLQLHNSTLNFNCK